MGKTANSDGTVGKALEVLDAVAAFSRPVRFSELLESSPYPKATLYRFLQTLTSQKMLNFDPRHGRYSLGMRLVSLAHAAWKQSSLAPIAKPFTEALLARVGETVHLAQFENGQVIFVDKLQKNDFFETLAQPGKVAPAYCTGVGKAMLAFMPPRSLQLALQQQAYYQYTPHTHSSVSSLEADLDEVRRQGVAYDREEHQLGIISIAVPILSAEGRVLGALSVATSTTRHGLDDLNAYRRDLIDAADNIAGEAASWQFPA